ncbi:MAG TPA: DMT family transporter [Prolixibacteraceae bacterium]|nr:DMT family transporter [Prolixibacteraceae bacterium]HPS12572.1 DMT family transporter [Prolixibacteraceae bacterium]
MSYVGEFAGLATALCWTVTAMSFQFASRRIGSVLVNLIRLVFAFLFYLVYCKITLGHWLPLDAPLKAWIYLSISGLIGFVLGDFFLFKSYEYVSSKISMLVMTLAPPIAAVLGWIMISEPFSLMNGLGMVLVLGGVALVVLKRDTENGEKKLRYPLKGILLAFGGAVGQGVGSVFSKIGMGDYDPFASSQIRVITGVIGFAIMISFMGQWKNIRPGLTDRKVSTALLIGSFFGPFLGVSLGMVAFKHTSLGVASTLMATVPVFILLPSHLLFKERLTINEVIGAMVAVGGIIVFFL